jgi:phosphatidylethanolamine/phosphatidyl-N-methylethanolamine N-methyltransferase
VAFAELHQCDVLSAVVAALAPQGVFTTFAYVHAWAPSARRLQRSLRARFDEVVASRTVWAYLPPVLVYHCRRPGLW